MVLFERFPGLRLRLLDPSHHILGKHRQRAVVIGRIAVGMQPAIFSQMLADFVLEADLFMQAHRKPSPAIW